MILEQGRSSGLLWFLIEGAVEVVKDGVQIAIARQPGAVFGEWAALLGNPRAFLEASPLVCLHVGEIVARRLDARISYLVDVQWASISTLFPASPIG